MADNYDIVGAIPSQRLDGAQNVIPTIDATGITKPHGVTFSVVVDKLPGWKAELAAKAAIEATELESLFDL